MTSLKTVYSIWKPQMGVALKVLDESRRQEQARRTGRNRGRGSRDHYS